MSNDTDIVTTTGPWLKWAWRHFSLCVDEFDSYDDALRSANYMSDAGEESLDCIEGPMGRVDPAQVERDLRVVEEAQEAVYRERPTATHGVKIKSPDGQHDAWFSTYYSESDAETAATRLREQLGDRVRVVKIGT